MTVKQSKSDLFDHSITELRTAIDFVNRVVVNRAEVIDQIFAALLTREHVLLQSRTGAAKSLLAQQIFALFSGASLFQVQASKEQQPDTYFGGLDIEELKKGRIIHNTTDSLVESEFGFIDEIFDANDYTLRSLLTTLNERALILGVQQVPSRLHSVIAATNYLRVSEITEAILDRFIFKSLILPSKTPSIQYEIAQRYLAFGGKPLAPPVKLPFTTLDAISRVVKGEDPEISIQVPKEIIFFANTVVRHYEMQRNRYLKEKPHEHPHLKDFYISPRTYARGMDMLRASAYFHGRDVVVLEDVARMWYMHTIVGMTDQKELFMKSYETVLHQFGAAKAFDQVRSLLEFQELLDRLKADPSLIAKPLSDVDAPIARRSLMQWAKDVLGLTHASVEQNRRLLEGYLASFSPVTEEIQELKLQQERDIHELFHPMAHIWS